MSSLSCVAAQIFDKLVDMVVGPVQGTVLATASSGTVAVLQGQLASLPDGRRVRVTQSKRITAGYPVALPSRLEFLSPSYPAVGAAGAGYFAPIANATVATWIDPPAGIQPTGATNAFAAGVRSNGLKISGVVEHDDADTPADSFAAGAQGTARLILLTPNTRRVGPDALITRGLYEATWRLRLVIANVNAQKESRALARDVFDQLVKTVHGATAGNDQIRLTGWTRIREAGWPNAWEATLLTRVAIDGRIRQAQHAPLQTIGADIRIPGDDAQPGPFRVLEDIEPTS